MLHYNPRLKTKARSLRANPTDAELRLWYRIRRKQILGIQFYRQKTIGNYIVDFYAPAVNICLCGSLIYCADMALGTPY